MRQRLHDRAHSILFWSGLRLLQGKRPTLILGDSHTLVFKGWNPPGRTVVLEWVGGATASGVRNVHSATEALPRFRAKLANVGRFQDVIVCLGEVDCGYIMWRRAEREGLSIDDQLDETLRRYAEFLAEVRGHGPHRVFVMAVPLPTLPDEGSEDWGEIAQRRSDISASQVERTALTLRFNERLRSLCDSSSMVFVDTTSAQLDQSTGLVRDDLLRHGQADHHLLDGPFREIIAAAFETVPV